MVSSCLRNPNKPSSGRRVSFSGHMKNAPGAYIYSWSNAPASEGPHSSNGTYDASSPNYPITRQPPSRSTNHRDSVASSQYLTVPRTPEYEHQDIPRLSSVPFSAIRGDLNVPKRTAKNLTPYPTQEKVFAAQMQESFPGNPYNQSFRTPQSDFYAPIPGPMPKPVIPKTQTYLPGMQATMKPSNVAREPLYGADYHFKGVQERSYEVVVRNPNTNRNVYVVLCPSLGHILPLSPGGSHRSHGSGYGNEQCSSAHVKM
ncbi:hypothetical protein CPB84DRAFT_1795197 [Gymnopilus junonius]|uniref:Uncharacterized protein n=1 Tax=Gymnopilus junonius TaxID=109634 RepID=A0A9P5N9X3_GYMJU|nr:hypothetical protein CPB84DRAFT_1795197 [Gymnopilus junonius]